MYRYCAFYLSFGILLLTACTVLSDRHNSNSSPTLTPSVIPNLALAQDNIWKQILQPITLPTPWSIQPCEGNAPLLCVFRNGEGTGTVEINIYTLESLPDFQKTLAETKVDLTAVDPLSPQYQTQVLTALRQWVEDYYAFFRENRQPEYGENITFSSDTPTEVAVGNLRGLRYGFAGVQSEGGVSEDRVGYVAFDGQALYVISTAFDPLSETGTIATLENFRDFIPHLSTLVAALAIPLPIQR